MPALPSTPIMKSAGYIGHRGNGPSGQYIVHLHCWRQWRQRRRPDERVFQRDVVFQRRSGKRAGHGEACMTNGVARARIRIIPPDGQSPWIRRSPTRSRLRQTLVAHAMAWSSTGPMELRQRARSGRSSDTLSILHRRFRGGQSSGAKDGQWHSTGSDRRKEPGLFL